MQQARSESERRDRELSRTVGAPTIKGAKVMATIKSHGRLDKVRIIKFRRRKHHRKQMGHRQYFTEIEITGIAG